MVLFDEKSPAKLLENIKPNIYTKGADYTLETLPERDIVIKNNIKVEFIEFVQGKSTTNVIKKINNNYSYGIGNSISDSLCTNQTDSIEVL